MINKVKSQKSKVKIFFFLFAICYMLLAISYIQARPIRDIRMNDASGIPLLKDSVVTFSGIVSVANQFGNSGPAFVFDNTGGVAVYASAVSQMVIGDSVTITGLVTLYSGLTEITQISLTTHASGRPVNPTPMTIPEIDDIGANYVENEGTLIRLNQVIIPGASGNFAGNTNYTIQDSLGNSSQLRIDGDVSSIVGVPMPTGYFNMTGAISQYDNSAPYFSGYQVMPRYIADLGIVPPPPTETTIPIDSAICDADSNGIPDLRGTSVAITGIVTAPTGIYSNTQTDIYVQDNTGGVNVFSFTYQPVALGDSVIVHGNVYFYRGKTEINNAVITILAHDRPLPEPIPVTCAMMNREPYEGSLVVLRRVFTSAFLLTGNQNYLLVDSTGTCTMRIDGDGNVPGLVMVQDTFTFTVIGIKSQYTSDTFPPVNTGYQFMPRYPTDFSRTLNNALPLLSINEVQRPGLDGSSSYYEGQYVKVRGRITGPANIFTSGSSYSLYIQDATNGVNIYAPQVDASYADLLDVPGTEWECIGRVTEYSGLTEVANGVMWLIDSIPQEITPQLLPFNTAVTEGMESELIQLTGQVIVEPASAGGAMNFTIKNGTPGIAVRVVDAAGIPLTWVKKNRRVRVVGIVGQYDTDYPYNTGYQVLVRFPSDLVDMTDSVPQATAMRIDTVYPNPFSPTDPDPVRQTALIKINSPTDYKVYLEVFDMEGRLVKRLLTNNPGGYNELYWDGKYDNFEPCPIGIYILNFKGITPDGRDVFVRKPIVIATKL